MADVVAFPTAEERTPHIAGKAQCIVCHHEWAAVAPSGTVWLECPQCKVDKGLFRYPCEPAGEYKIWICYCENQLFIVTPDGYFCPNCGKWQSGF